MNHIISYNQHNDNSHFKLLFAILTKFVHLVVSPRNPVKCWHRLQQLQVQVNIAFTKKYAKKRQY